MKNRPDFIVIHTAASYLYNKERRVWEPMKDIDVEDIRAWHKTRGFAREGYHYIILDGNHSKRKDGDIDLGRPEYMIGAHTRGLNHRSIGICLVGHGDISQPSPAQMKTLNELVTKLMQKYGIPKVNVIGHRDVNSLIDRGLIDERYFTSKTCPGRLFDLNQFRSSLP